MSAQEWKEKGNNFLKSKDYTQALNCYTEAINADDKDHIHYSNRSVCYFNMGQHEKALQDANTCISTKPDWAKGYLRKGMAEGGLDLYEEAKATYTKGLELEPGNQQLKDGLNEIEQNMKNPFKKNYSKLFTDPRTSKYMSDPQFNNMLQYAMNDQKVLMQLVQSDPRFMDVFSVLTGIDLTMMSEQADKSKKERDQTEKERKQREEAEKKVAEETRLKKEAEDKWTNMSAEEKTEELNKKEAEEHKLKGNEAFKARNFEEALSRYNKAIEVSPKELTYFLNRAGVYHEQKDYEKVIEDCNHVIENTFDFQKKGRAFGRIAFAYQEKGDYNKAAEYFERSLLENNDQRIKDALRSVQQLQKKLESEQYINPDLAEEANNRGNELYKQGKYPDALKEYQETLKRNPGNPKYYSNRAACLIKLLEFNGAAKDCDKALELDPNFLRAVQRKATCHMMMKEYHKAMDTYERGIRQFPDDKELKDGYYKCMNQINSGTPQDDKERAEHAFADPEIQRIIMDPRIQQLFKDLKENPQAANNAITKDEFIGNAFKKLVAAGVIKTK